MRRSSARFRGFLRVFGLGTIAAVLLVVAACAQEEPDQQLVEEETTDEETTDEETTDEETTDEETFELILGHATIDDAQDELAHLFVEELEALSGGRISGVVHSGGALGDNEEMNRNVREGVQHAIIQPTGFMAPYAAVFGALDMPFLFPNDELQHEILNTETPGGLIEVARGVNLEIVTWAPGGIKNLVTTFPVESIEDLAGQPFRVIQSPELVGQFESWGAVGHGMGLGEVYSALEHGVIQGLENPPDVVYRFRFHEVAPYYTLTRHGALTTVIAVNLRWLESLPEDLQEAVYEAGRIAADSALDIYLAHQEESLEALREEATVAELPAEALEELRAATDPVWDRIMQDEDKGAVLESIRASIDTRQ